MTPSSREIIEFWTMAQLMQWPRPLSLERGLSNEAAEYLCDVGLPRVTDTPFEIDHRVEALPRLGKSLVVIAYDGIVPIGIDLAANERVVSAEPKSPARFFNSSVIHFGASLYFFRRLSRPDTGEGDRLASETLKSSLLKLDPAALSDPKHCWSQILDQMAQGML